MSSAEAMGRLLLPNKIAAPCGAPSGGGASLVLYVDSVIGQMGRNYFDAFPETSPIMESPIDLPIR